mmetsp:Transcript_37961/g.114718  ORF Transcript_37961/g.114718 Transcript_37961/m.114718 type:complete len:217 (+) Transcript_37961:145-795(+)
MARLSATATTEPRHTSLFVVRPSTLPVPSNGLNLLLPPKVRACEEPAAPSCAAAAFCCAIAVANSGMAERRPCMRAWWSCHVCTPSQKARTKFIEDDKEATVPNMPQILSPISTHTTGIDTKTMIFAAKSTWQPHISSNDTKICEQSSGMHGTSKLKSSMAMLLTSIMRHTIGTKWVVYLQPRLGASWTRPPLNASMATAHNAIMGRCVAGPMLET